MEIKRNRKSRNWINISECLNPSLNECSKNTGISYDTLLEIKDKCIIFVDSGHKACLGFPAGICPSIEINPRRMMNSNAKLSGDGIPKQNIYNIKRRRRIIINFRALVFESIKCLLHIEPKMTFVSMIKNLTSILCAMCSAAIIINSQESFILSLLYSKYSCDEYIKRDDILNLVNQIIEELQLQYMNGYNIKESIYKEIISMNPDPILVNLVDKGLIKNNNDEYFLPKKIYISL